MGHNGRRVLAAGCAALAMAAGLLIWARLRLVAGVPRTALAEPRSVERPAPGPAPLPGPVAEPTPRPAR